MSRSDRTRRPRRLDSFCKVEKRIVVALADCPHCLVLYSWIDCEIGDHVGERTWFRTAAAAARELAWQVRTVEKHAQHLHGKSLLGIDQRDERRTASWRLWLVHQPVRGAASGKAKAKLRTPAPRATRSASGLIRQKRASDGRFLRVIEGGAS